MSVGTELRGAHPTIKLKEGWTVEAKRRYKITPVRCRGFSGNVAAITALPARRTVDPTAFDSARIGKRTWRSRLGNWSGSPIR